MIRAPKKNNCAHTGCVAELPLLGNCADRVWPLYHGYGTRPVAAG